MVSLQSSLQEGAVTLACCDSVNPQVISLWHQKGVEDAVDLHVLRDGLVEEGEHVRRLLRLKDAAKAATDAWFRKHLKQLDELHAAGDVKGFHA